MNVGVEFYGFFVAGDRLRPSSLSGESLPQITVSPSQIWVEFDRQAIAAFRFRPLKLFGEGVAELIVRLGKIGVEFDGLLQECDGFIEAILL